MQRSIAASTAVSIAVHAALVAALIGIRYETSEKAAFGATAITWVLLGDRIDAGSGEGTAANAAPAVIAASSASDAATDPPQAIASSNGPAADAAQPSSADAVETTVPDSAEAVTADAAEAPDAAESFATDAADAADAAEAATPESAEVATANAVPAAQVGRDDTAPASRRTTAAGSSSSATELSSNPNEQSAPSSEPSQPVPSQPVPPSQSEPQPPVPPVPPSPPVPPPQPDPLVVRVESLTLKADALSRLDPVVFEHEGQEYTATFRGSPAADDMGLDELVAAVSTERGGERQTTKMTFKRLAFSHFAQFVDRWDASVQIHDDEIDGRFHANSEIFIDTSRGIEPTFRGKVTTARGVSTSNGTRRFSRDDVFLGGLETRIRRIPLPKELMLRPPEDETEERVHRFADDTRVVFYSDGSYGWQAIESSRPEQRRPLPQATFYVLGADDVRLFVRGTLDGRVLVHSREEIVIEGDLTYASNPEVDPRSDDYLGLVSDKNVEIAEPDVTGPGDLDVHASIYAKRRFVVRRYNAREGSTLSILGGVTAGSLSATEPRYRTRLRFDPRLENARPPGFPMTDRYELASWDGIWTTSLPEG